MIPNDDQIVFNGRVPLRIRRAFCTILNRTCVTQWITLTRNDFMRIDARQLAALPFMDKKTYNHIKTMSEIDASWGMPDWEVVAAEQGKLIKARKHDYEEVCW